MKDLQYRDVAMRWEPVNIRREALVDALRAGRQVYVCLEPGDATRYELLVTYLPTLSNPYGFGAFTLSREEAAEGLLVTRLVSGQVVGTALIGWFAYGNVARLANGSDWTAELLDWWLGALIELLAPQPAAIPS